MNKEIWKDVIGYEGLYQVSNTGYVKSLDREVVCKNGRTNKHNGKVLALHKSKVSKQRIKPIYHVELWKNNKREVAFIHRLVAIHFIPNTENKPHINHIDGKRENNNVSNLEWCTPSENMFHAYANGLAKPRGEKAVRGTNIKTNEVVEFRSIREASRKIKGNDDAIRSCLKGRSKTSGGYVWEFIN